MANDNMTQMAVNNIAGSMGGVEDLRDTCTSCHRKLRSQKADSTRRWNSKSKLCWITKVQTSKMFWLPSEGLKQMPITSPSRT